MICGNFFIFGNFYFFWRLDRQNRGIGIEVLGGVRSEDVKGGEGGVKSDSSDSTKFCFDSAPKGWLRGR